MKIIYILKSLAMTAGVERVMSDKMNWLAEHGYDITMVTYEQGQHPLVFPLHPSIRHIDLDTRFFSVKRYSYPIRLLMIWRMRHQFRNRLQTFLDEISPDFIITTTYSIKLIDIILSVTTDACRIIESHVACCYIKKAFDFRRNFLLRTIAGSYDNMMLGKVAKADCLVTLTNGDATDWSIYTSNVIVIPNPVTYFPEAVKYRDGTGRRILCVGRLDEQKGFDLLIDAFELIADRCPGWKIDIFGDGSDKAMLLEKIKQKGLQNQMEINPPTSNIYDEYMRSDFFVLSSRYEGYPLVLNEAMSCGIPCVAFRCKYGPEDAITDGVNGLLVEKGNIEDLANKILWMITHTEERLSMGVKAREAALRYKKDAIMNQWVGLFNRLMNNN